MDLAVFDRIPAGGWDGADVMGPYELPGGEGKFFVLLARFIPTGGIPPVEFHYRNPADGGEVYSVRVRVKVPVPADEMREALQGATVVRK